MNQCLQAYAEADECSAAALVQSKYKRRQEFDKWHGMASCGGAVIDAISSSSTSFQTSPPLIIPSFTTESTPADTSLVSPSGLVATCSRVHTSSTSPAMVTPSVVEPLVSGGDGSIVHVEPINVALQETPVLVNQQAQTEVCDDFSDETPQLSLETGVHSPLMDEIADALQVKGSTFEQIEVGPAHVSTMLYWKTTLGSL
ncbi:hypothetical protein V6N11_082156 [Hibiscus sabdariffa]|uniref:Uncharacterized protein n=1 Tax=Hibiscus sabdariffa TaxID=183260 RepID=A0ABR2QHJ9_9ROSI